MSLKASTASSSYSISAGCWRAMMRQKTHSVTGSSWNGLAIIAERRNRIAKELVDGHVPEVQAEDPEERQPREARHHVVPQGLPGPFRHRQEESLARPLESSPSSHARRLRRHR